MREKKPKSTEIASGEECCKHLSSIELERLENLACFSSKLPAFVVQLDLALVLLSRKVDQLCDSGNSFSLPELQSEILFAKCLPPDSCSKTQNGMGFCCFVFMFGILKSILKGSKSLGQLQLIVKPTGFSDIKCSSNTNVN